MSYIGKNPKLNSLTYTPQSADPATPTEGMIFFSDGTARAEGFWQYVNGEWLELGSGDDSGGINYVLNPDFEGGVNGWATYADAAGATPVDGTGGSPTTTFTRTTTSADVLRGAASGLITKDAADRQGEGVSYDLVVDNIDVLAIQQISFDYKVSANFVTGASSDLRVYAYDIDNGGLITPAAVTIDSTEGTFQTTFLNTNTKNVRLIFHIATTNASAWTMSIDNVRVGPNEVSAGIPTMTSWQSYTPTYTGLGTVTTNFAQWRRVGDTLELQGAFVTGTPTGTAATISFPNAGWLTDTIYPTGGSYALVGDAGRNFFSASVFRWGVLAERSLNTVRLSIQTSTIEITAPVPATSLAGTSSYFNWNAKVRIAGWTATN